MVIFDDTNKPLIIDSIFNQMTSGYFWIFQMDELDFTLSPLISLEMIECASVEIIVKGFPFVVPAHWNILVFDDETSQLDVVDISSTAGKEFTAVVHGPECRTIEPGIITVSNYFPSYVNVQPVLPKYAMLCHAISETQWVSVGTYDGYNKFFKNALVNNLLF